MFASPYLSPKLLKSLPNHPLKDADTNLANSLQSSGPESYRTLSRALGEGSLGRT
jgi:hypothetical protein